MSMIHQPTSLPGFAALHSTQKHEQRNTSRFGLLSSVARVIRDPASISAHLLANTQTDTFLYDPGYVARRSILYLKLKSATSTKEWRAAAIELDSLENNDAWKYELESTEYDAGLVESRLKELDDARISCDISRMLFLIRTSLSRYLGGMGNTRLYKHSHIGTKALIERYIGSALETITALLDQTRIREQPDLESRVLLEQVVAARQSFGRSALLLSGGGTFGMNHVGVVKCLWETRLLPRIISGSSAGSIVCAVLCTKTDEEIPKVLKDFCYGDLEVFTKEGEDDGILRQVARFLKIGALFDIGNLTRVMKDILGDLTFQEAYNRTRRILNIHVSSASLYELPKLLNYITSPNVIIWSAVAASCSVPFLFTSATLLAKDPRTGEATPWNASTNRWIDGSVDSDLPMARLAEMFNVNHFIVSQVNPHVIPFLKESEDLVSANSQITTNTHGWLQSIANLAKDEVMHRMHIMAELGVLPNLFTKTRSVLNQKYAGDINIFPEVPYSSFPRVLVNPTTDFMLQASLCGERATWPKLSMIQNHCAIELALDDAVQQLRARIAFSRSQVDLRMNVITRPVSRAGSDTTGTKSKRDHRYKSKTAPFNALEAQAVAGASAHWLPPSLSPPPPYSDMPAFNAPTPTAYMGLPSNIYALYRTSPIQPPTIQVSNPQPDPSDFHFHSHDTTDDDDEYDDLDDDSPLTISTASSFPRNRPNRRLFPHASQPSTPYTSLRSARSYFAPPPPPLGLTTAPTTPKSDHVSGGWVLDTKIPLPTRLSVANKTTAARRSPLRSKSYHEGGAAGVLYANAGAAAGGGLTRKQRSLSTGLRALMPPAGQ